MAHPHHQLCEELPGHAGASIVEASVAQLREREAVNRVIWPRRAGRRPAGHGPGNCQECFQETKQSIYSIVQYSIEVTIQHSNSFSYSTVQCL
jgi:hypothetical protein